MKGDYDGFELSEDFMTNVLPHLIPGARKENWRIALRGGKELELNLSYNFTTGTQYEPTGKRFVHFTSLRTLQSIVNEQTIRMYDLFNVNDPNEYCFFPDGILNDFELSEMKKCTYVLSLCDVNILEDERNVLNLWRLYGNEGWGVAIEFEIDFQFMSSTRDYFLGKVIYEKPDFEKFTRENEAFEKRNGDISLNLKELLRVPLCFHKKNHYSIESEIRLMTFNDSSNIVAKIWPQQNQYKPDINSRNEVVTYHRIGLSHNESQREQPSITIKRIQLGFNHSEKYFKEVFNPHFSETFGHLILEGIWKSEMPVIEHSPLQNIYR